MMVAAGGPSASTLDCGITTSVDGATPNVHWSMAPIATWLAMGLPASGDRLLITKPGAAAGSIGHARARLKQAGFASLTVERAVLRTEGSAAVMGLVVSVR
jgi:hypothetical protein